MHRSHIKDILNGSILNIACCKNFKVFKVLAKDKVFK